MNKSLLLLLFIFLLFSCRKQKEEDVCKVTHMPFDYSSQQKTLIPINTRNFWTYSDSVFNPESGALEHVATTLIKIEDVFQIGDQTYFQFTELFAPMTISGDTLFFINLNDPADPGACYTLKKSYFPFSDTLQFGSSPQQIAYKDSAAIFTPAGIFSNNIIYNDSGLQQLTFHEGVGLIKVTNYLGNGILRRSLTLKDYSVQ